MQTREWAQKATNPNLNRGLSLTTSTATSTNALMVAKSTGESAAIQISEASHTAPIQSQKPSQEEFVVASADKIMAAFLESEPRYENLYRRLAEL